MSDANFEIVARHRPASELSSTACYVDYAGAGQPTAAQLSAVHAQQLSAPLANPHSASSGAAAALRSQEAVERVRERVLAHVGASARTHAVVFVANATAAVRLVGELVVRAETRVVHAQVNHTSLLGLRGVAAARGAPVQMLRESELNHWSLDCIATCRAGPACSRCLWLAGGPAEDTPVLLAVPAMCNFSGTVYDVGAVVRHVRRRVPRTRVLVDAAAFAATHALDLTRQVGADFVCLSLYKLFGFPTGVGCLVATLDAARELVRCRAYFGGGTLASLRVDRIDAPALRGGDRAPHEALEDGTPDYHGIAAAQCGFDALDALGGVVAIGERARLLAERVREQLAGLRHGNGASVVALYGCADAARRSSIVAFNVRRADGSAVGFSEVAALARLAGVELRTGCFCNVGACAHYLQWREPHYAAMERAQRSCGDDNDVLRAVDAATGAPLEVQTGAVRVSFGALSLPRDADCVVDFVRRFFVDAVPAPAVRATAADDASTTVTIAELWIYPIKSCGGVRVERALPLLRTGLQFDREFVLVDDQDVFYSQKRVPRLALVQPTIDFERETLTLRAPGMAPLELALARGGGGGGGAAATDVLVCGAQTAAQFVGTGDEWFSQFLGRPCRLARQPADAPDWRTFQNTSALLLVNQASVDELNERLPAESRIDHRPFRANVVVRGAAPFAEDSWRAVRARGDGEPFTLLVTGRCNRCQMINIAPDSGTTSDEPLRTLALYRRVRGQIAFGVHLSPTAASVDRLEQRTLAPGAALQLLF